MTTNLNTNIPIISFNSTLHKIKKWTILRLPAVASQELPSRGQVMVKGKINGHDFSQVLEPDGNWGHWFKLDSRLLKMIDARDGDVVGLEISPSKEWPEPSIPKDFSNALAVASISTQRLWAVITPMARWEWIRWINATNNGETRNRRVEVSISKLQSGKRRPCCFNLAACTDPDLSKSGRLIETSTK